MKNGNYPKRKHPRLKNYDYSAPNYYFITICTDQKKCIFGDPGKLNPLGNIAKKYLLEIPERYENVILDQYVVMPNHVHAIIVLQNNEKNVETIIGQYKSAVTKEIRKYYPDMMIWQTSFYDHIIRNQKSYEKIWIYIEDNQRKWEEDCFYADVSQW